MEKINKASSGLLRALHATEDHDAAMKLSAVHDGGTPSGSLVTEKRACKRKWGQRKS